MRILAVVCLFLSVLVAPAWADPNWTAGTFVQTCNETFPGPTLNRSTWAQQSYPTAAPFFSDGDLSVAIPGNIQMIPGGGVEIVAKHQNFPVTKQFGMNYTSGFLNAAGGGLGCGYQLYGWYEAKMKLPSIAGGANGLWPAFWLLNRTGTYWELDIFERFNSPYPSPAFDNTWVTTTLHCTSCGISDGNGVDNKTYICTMQNTKGWADAYHTWALDWEPSSLQIYIDGNLCTTSSVPAIGTNAAGCCNSTGTYTGAGIPSTPGIVLFDNIVDWVTNPAQDELMTTNSNASAVQIAYYKVWQKNSQIEAPLGVTSSTTQCVINSATVPCESHQFNPGDTITFTSKITTGNSSETNVDFSGYLFDLCGDSPGFQACATNNNNFGSQVVSNVQSSMAANTTQTFTGTLTLPTNIPAGIYIFEGTANDAAGDHYGAYCQVIVGNAQP